MAEQCKHEWRKWHPWCAMYRCVVPGCYKNMPSDEVETRLNAAEELSSKDAREAARLLSERINLNSARKQLAYAEARGDT